MRFLQNTIACLAVVLMLPGMALAQGGGLADTDKMGMKQMRSQSEQVVNEMKTMLRDVFDLLEEAQQKKDVVKINCLREKVTAMKGLLRIAEQSAANLGQKAAESDEEGVQHEFVKVTIAKQKVEQLHSEAQTCAGEGAQYSGETESQTDGNEDLEDFNEEEDAGGGTEEEPPAYDKPQQSSPY
jgi:hypothetical protein